MRFSVVAIVAAVVAVASAQDLNPLYPFKPDGPCISKCLTDVGNKMMPGVFTSDPANPNFLKSLGLAHDRGTPKYTAYMTDTGTCFLSSGCPMAEQNLYREQYIAKAKWYADKLAEAESGVAPSGNPSTPSSTAGSGNGGATSSAGTPGASTVPNAAAGSAAVSGFVGAAAVLAAAALF